MVRVSQEQPQENQIEKQIENPSSEQPIELAGPSSAVPAPSTDLVSSTLDTRARDVKLWLPSLNAPPPPRPALGEEYFAPTASEAQRAFAGQVAHREKLTDAPLLTKSLREREQKQIKNERLARFPITRIRIKFVNQSMLEGSFPSTSTISDVYQFLNNSLLDEASVQNFILYQTPPRREFRLTDPKVRSSNLLDLQLAPSSVLLIKFQTDSYNHASNPPPLLSELLKTAEPLPLPPTYESGASDQAKDSTLEKGKQKIDEILKSGAKVPKWLQNLKKK